jgi:multiple sugar transport system permease protein
VAMIPFLLVATLVCFFGVGRRKWQQGSDND